MKPELENRILAAIALQDHQVARREGHGSLRHARSRGAARLVAFLLVVVGSLIAFGLLHSEHHATRTLSGAEIAIFTLTPLAAVSAGLLRDSLRFEPVYRSAYDVLHLPGF